MKTVVSKPARRYSKRSRDEQNSSILVSDDDISESDTGRNMHKRKKLNDPIMNSSSPSVSKFQHFLANQTLYGLLKKHDLPLSLIDDYFFQQFLVVVRLAGEDYHPTASTVWQDNLLTRGLSSENDADRL